MPDHSLCVGAFGDAVVELQHRLRDNRFDVPEAERARRFFGPGTREAVRKFQAQHRLKPTGIVDERTAAGLGMAPDASGGDCGLGTPAAGRDPRTRRSGGSAPPEVPTEPKAAPPS